MIYSYQSPNTNAIKVDRVPAGVRFRAFQAPFHGTSVTLPDDEIPNLISALQNYMSRKARALSKAGRAAG